MNLMETVSFRKSIPANTKDVLQERIKSDGTIEGLRIRFYSGQQLQLRVRAVIEHRGAKIEDLISYPETTDLFLSGDDDYFIYPISTPVQYDDYIKIFVENKDLALAYNLSVDVVVDYYGGKNRVVSAVIGQ